MLKYWHFEKFPLTMLYKFLKTISGLLKDRLDETRLARIVNGLTREWRKRKIENVTEQGHLWNFS